jgi:hypothetical protein
MLLLHLYPSYFTLNDLNYSYQGPLQDFLFCLQQQALPIHSSDLFDESDYEQGCLIVCCIDHRSHTQFHVKLRPSNASIQLDAQSLPMDPLEAESKLLLSYYPQLSLDPSIDVLYTKSIQDYNISKYHQPKKPKLDSLNHSQLYPSSSDVSHASSFQLLSFVEDWRQKKLSMDQEPLVGLGDKRKGRFYPCLFL